MNYIIKSSRFVILNFTCCMFLAIPEIISYLNIYLILTPVGFHVLAAKEIEAKTNSYPFYFSPTKLIYRRLKRLGVFPRWTHHIQISLKWVQQRLALQSSPMHQRNQLQCTVQLSKMDNRCCNVLTPLKQIEKSQCKQ